MKKADSKYFTNRDSCIFYYNKLIHEFPDSIDPYLDLGFIYYTNRKYDKALQPYSAALKKFPKEAKLYLKRSDIYEKLKDYNNAIIDLTFYIVLTNDFTEYLRRGKLYYKNEEYELAIKDFTHCIELEYQLASSYLYRGDSKISIGDLTYCDDYYKAWKLGSHQALLNYAYSGCDDSLRDCINNANQHLFKDTK